MDKKLVLLNREKLQRATPIINDYISKFRSINKCWGGSITLGMIEVSCMDNLAYRLFTPLIRDMSTTKGKYSEIQQQLINAILFEMARKVILEITDTAKFAINILKRNLFERTADVGYLATDSEIVNFLKLDFENDSPDIINQRKNAIHERLVAYQYEYTVYNEIIILDINGNIRSNLDRNNKTALSSDSLLNKTQAIDLHSDDFSDKYIETFRQSDLLPGKDSALIYSQKIEEPETGRSIGTLCLCFDFENEMDGIFNDLRQGNKDIVIAILDEDGKVLCSSDQDILARSARIPINLEADFSFLTFNDKIYMASTVETDGYQGFYGLTWYGLVMIELNTAFRNENSEEALTSSVKDKLHDFSSELSSIKFRSETLLDDMRIDSINGKVMAEKFRAHAFVEVLQFVKWIGMEIDNIFSSAIANLQETIASSMFNDAKFRAFQANNIADRNLYERANDVCWWALTPAFRVLMKKHSEKGLDEEERKAVTKNLQYINDLYTPYLRLILADKNGIVVATSNPPDGLEEIFKEEGLPSGQDIVGIKLDMELINEALALPSSKDYCVSGFMPTPLYGGRPTYIYSTSVRDPEDENKPVGVIQIVFDAEPQFQAMLTAVLPRDDSKNIKEGSFAVFTDRHKKVISSTNTQYPPGSILNIDDSLFKMKKGERYSTILDIDSRCFATGIQVSDGYREYKQKDGYRNDIVCMIFVPI